MRVSLAALLLVAACAPSDGPGPPPAAPEEAVPEAVPPASPDTLTISADDRALAERPAAPIRVEGACPFEGCVYGPWTTSAATTVYAASGDTTSAAFTVPAGTALEAAGGFVLVTRLGAAVAARPTSFYVGFEDERPVAEGDTLWILDYEGEGSFRVWHGGTLGFSGAGAETAAPGEDGPALRRVAEPETQWWARVAAPDGRAGWLWMDRTPSVAGADALAG